MSANEICLNADILCPDCTGVDTKLIGQLPDVALFAGQTLSRPLIGGRLFHCLSCDLKFRCQVGEGTRNTQTYDNALTEAWTTDASTRTDWAIARSMIKGFGGRRPTVLDVGCYTGGFLDSLGQGVIKAGVEPNTAAASRTAEGLGIDVWPSIAAIPEGRRFDFIVAIDVLEHVEKPTQFIASLEKHLEDQGAFIVSTGDANARLSRLFGANWWYCFFPEHISFVSKTWFNKLCISANYGIAHLVFFNYKRLSGLTWCLNFVQTVAYGLGGRFYISSLEMAFRLIGRHWAVYPKGMGVSNDHLIAMIKKTKVRKT